MRRKKEPHKNKRRGLSLKPLIIGMSACVVLLGGVLLWAVLGSVRLEPESGHGLGIVDAVNTMGLQKKTQELAAKPSAASSPRQRGTPEPVSCSSWFFFFFPADIFCLHIMIII